MSAADWARRAFCGVGLLGLTEAPGYLFAPTDARWISVTVYLCAAAIANALSIILSATVLRGRIAYDMQRLAYCAIVVNFLSFLAFSAKISPIVSVLNTTITVISYAQLARLLWPRNGNLVPHNRRFGLFRFAALQGKSIHLEEKKQ